MLPRGAVGWQKTGAFLDQRPNRILAGSVTRPGGRALDCFAYHGSFSLHLAGRAGSVIALDSSPGALERARANAALNRLENIEWREADAFEELRAMARAHERFDTIVLDPPPSRRPAPPSRTPSAATARSTCARCAAWPRRHPPHRLLLPFVRLPDFLGMLAHGGGRQRPPHPRAPHPRRRRGPSRVLTVPETGYLKGALLEAE